MRFLHIFTLLAAVFLLTGCEHYIPPSGRADLSAISGTASQENSAQRPPGAGPTLQESFAARPAAGFPAGIAAVRVQAPAYRSYYTEHEGGVYGTGRYSVITVKEVEDEADFERVSKLRDIAGLISISPLLLPQKLEDERQLREAAARLKADMLLLYTFETTFHDKDFAPPLTVVTLGLSPNRQISVHVTASALLIDTRTGFIYAAFETNQKQKLLSDAFTSNLMADRARQSAEKAAFKGLVKEFETQWPAIVERAKKGA
jgi:hypothetical protein